MCPNYFYDLLLILKTHPSPSLTDMLYNVDLMIKEIQIEDIGSHSSPYDWIGVYPSTIPSLPGKVGHPSTHNN